MSGLAQLLSLADNALEKKTVDTGRFAYPSGMAKSKGMTVYRGATRSAAPIINIPAPRVIQASNPKRRGPRRRSGGGGGMFGGSDLMNVMLAAGAAGMAKKAGLLDSLPSLPVVGRVGAGAVLAHFWAKNGGGPFARHVSIALASVAAYQMASKGEIDGEEDGSEEALEKFSTR